MKGERAYLSIVDVFKLEPGQYGKHPGHGNWYGRTPCGHMANLTNHKITEHEDGTITVSPSILITRRSKANGDKELFHGYLEKGIWRSV